MSRARAIGQPEGSAPLRRGEAAAPPAGPTDLRSPPVREDAERTLG